MYNAFDPFPLCMADPAVQFEANHSSNVVFVPKVRHKKNVPDRGGAVM